MSAEGELNASVSLRRGATRVGLERAALLEAIDELGSISAAARRQGLSYKGAWDQVQALNNLFDAPLVAAAPGGRSGGAASLTPRGRAVVAAFRRVERELAAALEKVGALVSSGESTDLFWSLGMRTSARNALRGVVAKISEGAVNSEVTLEVAPGVEIVAMVTRQSVADLDLATGKPAIALIDAGFVVLVPGEETLRTTARNQLPGVVSARDDGAVNTEVTVDLGGGKTIVAVVTRQSAESLALCVGDPATVLVKAPHVIVAVE